jgi:ribosome-binding factor A
MTSGRMRRVDEAIRQVIGEVVASELKDPRVGFVTVTDVRTSADLSHARVYVSVLGDEPAREATLAGLRSAHGYMQRRVASELRLKRTPTLDFIYDDTTDRAMRLEALLDEPGAGPDRLGADVDEPQVSEDRLEAGADVPQAGVDAQEGGGDE